ncbi:hypothetical protein [Nocardia sp. NPDC004711]
MSRYGCAPPGGRAGLWWCGEGMCRLAELHLLAVVDALCGSVGDFGLHSPDSWLPADDPHRQEPSSPRPHL